MIWVLSVTGILLISPQTLVNNIFCLSSSMNLGLGHQAYLPHSLWSIQPQADCRSTKGSTHSHRSPFVHRGEGELIMVNSYSKDINILTIKLKSDLMHYITSIRTHPSNPKLGECVAPSLRYINNLMCSYKKLLESFVNVLILPTLNFLASWLASFLNPTESVHQTFNESSSMAQRCCNEFLSTCAMFGVKLFPDSPFWWFNGEYGIEDEVLLRCSTASVIVWHLLYEKMQA